MYDPVEVNIPRAVEVIMTHAEIEKYATWKVDSEYIKITLKSIRNRIESNEALGILCGAEYGTLVTQINELCAYASTELEVTWLSEMIVEMHKCILNDLRLLEEGTNGSTSWITSRDRAMTCEILLGTYKSFKLRDKATEARIEKTFRRLVSICNGDNMGKEVRPC